MNGARLEVHADGSLDAYTVNAVHVHSPANDSSCEDFPSAASPRSGYWAVVAKPGDRMDDGTVYSGISPDTGKPMYAMPADATLAYTFNQAQKYAAKLDAFGHADWRVPTKGELTFSTTTGRPSEGLMNPVRIPPVGTGRLRRTSALLGVRASATGSTFCGPALISW